MRAPPRQVLAASAVGAWLLVFASIVVAPANYGVLNETIPPDPLDAARFHLARILFHSAQAAQILIAVFAAPLVLVRRKRSWSAGIAFALSSAFITFGVASGTYPNVGLPFGYYGKFNRMQRLLDACPGFEIRDSWQHRDLTLEDFGFTLEEPGGRRLELEFDGALSFAELEESVPERCR